MDDVRYSSTAHAGQGGAQAPHFEVRRHRRGWRVALITPPSPWLEGRGRHDCRILGFVRTETAATDYAQRLAANAGYPVQVFGGVRRIHDTLLGRAL